ncbi:MAG: hypothetical protein ACYCV7_02725 [Acidimicrobiales bacterium]
MIHPDPEFAGQLAEQDIESPRVHVHRFDPHMCVIEISGPGYREFFCIVTTAKTITVMTFDPSDESSDGPHLHHIPRPYGWNTDVEAEEMLLLVWQATGYER